jgi:hypothetical protein
MKTPAFLFLVLHISGCVSDDNKLCCSSKRYYTKTNERLVYCWRSDIDKLSALFERQAFQAHEQEVDVYEAIDALRTNKLGTRKLTGSFINFGLDEPFKIGQPVLPYYPFGKTLKEIEKEYKK